MGNFESLLTNYEIDCLNEEKNLTLKIMTYNVEWGFINLPENINTDSCGHKIPLTTKAQYNHLDLCVKNIGLISPDICFLQEIGSLEVMKYFNKKLRELFNLNYSYSYSNKLIGNQGVGVLINSKLKLNYKVSLIPKFNSNKALGITFYHNQNFYQIVGVHLKSFFDQKIKIDTDEQIQQIDAVCNWINKNNKDSKCIICGDFNNVPTSEPILHIIEKYGFMDLIDSDKYVPNITNNKFTEFYLKKESNEDFTTSKIVKSRIDYILTKNINCNSVHIVNLQRENNNSSLGLRDENSDHLPVVAIVNIC